jgi:predicted transcriptional regulator
MLIAQSEWVSVAESLGVPAAVLFAIMFFIWRVAKATSPYLRKIFDKHIEFVDAAQENSDRCVDVSERTTELLEEIHQSQQCVKVAMAHAASAMEEIATEAKKEKVKVHTTSMKKELGGV